MPINVIREYSVLTAFLIIAIILISGFSRFYLRRKFDVSGHLDEVEKAAARNKEVRINNANI